MMTAASTDCGLDPQTRTFYQQTIATLQKAQLPFLVGGAYAMAYYTGITRHTKDLDIFVRPQDARRALDTLERAANCPSELTFPWWLGKAACGDASVDVIFSSGNGIARVDDGWFKHARVAEVFGVALSLVAPEEMLWSKSFIAERERYDGADVAHVLRACANQLDWQRLLGRFGPNWRVLFSHLVLFGHIYPAERAKIPAWVMDELLGRLQTETHAAPPQEYVCNGTLLSRQQYLVDITEWGYQDGRLVHDYMDPQEIEHWTASIRRDGDPHGPQPPAT
jgi:hypothetical protein